ncbi:MAG: hypothetical protein KA761_12090 [Gemmatimonadaceae bacterium]|jgi:hypothetical protein|nr:hypothetical protein [Gemmatimonadaceae bacterium]
MRVVSLKPFPTSSSTADLWRDRVATWQRSGLSADDFCEDQPYAASTLLGWSSRLRRTTATTFIELRPRKPVVARSTELVVEIGAARVRVAPGFDPALLAAVVTALQGAIG